MAESDRVCAPHRLSVCIPQRRWALSGSGFSFGSLDRQAKPLLQCVGVDALVVAPFRDGASEEHDTLRREGDENVLHRLDRIALTGVTVSVESGALGQGRVLNVGPMDTTR